MFKFTYAAKVGLLFVVGIFLFFMTMGILGKKIWSFKKPKGYTITIVFENTKGLQEGYEVQYNGFWIGDVGQPQRHRFGEVEVPVHIFNNDYKIHRNAFFAISRESIFGSYILYISEGSGGILLSQDKAKNIVTLEMPRGQTVRGAEVVYHHPSEESGGPVGAGTLIGTVLDIVKNPDDVFSDLVTVVMLPNTGVELTSDHTFVPSHRQEIRMVPATTGQANESVVVGQVDVYERIKDGDTVIGFREPGPEDLVSSADTLIKSASEAIGKVSVSLTDVVANINSVLSGLGDELTGEGEGTLKSKIFAAVDKLQSGLTNVETLTGNLNSILTDAKPRIDSILAEVENAAGNVGAATSDVRNLLSDPEFTQSIQDAINNLDSATQEVLNTVKEIESLVSDESFKGDIKGLVSGARDTVEKASKTLDEAQTAISAISGTQANGEFRFRYFPDPERFASDLDFTITPPKGRLFYRAGLDDIGETNKFNFQLGMSSGKDWAGRVGLKRGYVGAGVDYDDGRFVFHGDLYDPNDLHFDIYGGYAISKDFRVIIGFEDIYDEDLFQFGIATKF